MMFKLAALIPLVAILSTVMAAPAVVGAALARATGPPPLETIRTVLNTNKCVGIVGGTFANGTQAGIFDCNGSSSQTWQFWPPGEGIIVPGAKVILTSPNPGDTSTNFCLDAGPVDQLANGVQIKIWKCFNNLPQQQWVPLPSGQLQLSTGGWCLDLTDGRTDNRNILQVWECGPPNSVNQQWQLDVV